MDDGRRLDARRQVYDGAQDFVAVVAEGDRAARRRDATRADRRVNRPLHAQVERADHVREGVAHDQCVPTLYGQVYGRGPEEARAADNARSARSDRHLVATVNQVREVYVFGYLGAAHLDLVQAIYPV